jgi:hypothetical protein
LGTERRASEATTFCPVQLAKLLDAYLAGRFPKKLLAERRTDLDKRKADLERERQDLQDPLSQVAWTEDKIEEVEAAVSEIATGLDGATFADKRSYFDLVDVRASFALEDGAKVVDVKCRLGKQRLSVVPISPLSSTGVTATRSCGCPPTRRCR